MKKIIIFVLGVILFGCKTDFKKDHLIAEKALFLVPAPQQLEILENFKVNSDFFENLQISVETGVIGKPEGYYLKIEKTGIFLKAEDEAGVFYGKQTLKQIESFYKEKGVLHSIEIRDWPDFPNRGVMLDISRNKVPTMDTLFLLIDRLAQFKVNQFQLYTEHTFSYKNHKVVWEEDSPMTAEQIQVLDEYCRQRFVKLVANQNSFGHMEKWLEHEEYLQLAEVESNVETIAGPRSKLSLSPAVPGSLDLMRELYTELLPNFSSGIINIGCDETVELGLGKSKLLCKEKGKGEVYLNYLNKLYNIALENGFSIQFWADIILHYSDLISKLKDNVTALIWGYEADHPFSQQAKLFKDNGVDFYLCPGTSSWGSITGRIKNMKANILNAAVAGKEYCSSGLLITTWGDYGHWQTESFSWPGYIYGASLAWSLDTNKELNLAHAISSFLYNDSTGIIGDEILKLGDIYLQTGIEIGNESVLHRYLRQPKIPLIKDYYTRRSSLYRLNKVLKELERINLRLENADPDVVDGEIVIAEINQSIRLLRHSAFLARAKKKAFRTSLENVKTESIVFLKRDIEDILFNFQKLWLKRNRKGGLQYSIEGMNKLLNEYDNLLK